jgi:rsbT co-antagonist protein RsbR
MMSTTTREKNRVSGPMAGVDQEGLQDFWSIYDENFDALTASTAELLADDEEFGSLLRATPQEETERQNAESREMLRKAIQEDAWDEYFAYLKLQGGVYARMGISFSGWFRVIGVFRPLVTELLIEQLQATPDRMASAIAAMNRFMDAVLSAIGEEYLDVKSHVIREQELAIRDLSTPVLKLSDELLLLPVVGVIDSNRARVMTDDLLLAIRAHRAKVVVIDITGVAAVDSMVANHLLQAVEASRLLGARVLLTGLSAEVAQTVVRIGVDLTKVETAGNLQDGVEEANRTLGYRLTKLEPGRAKG